MIKITDILTVPSQGAYYFDDLAALQTEPIPVQDRYRANPITPGFQAVREPAEALSVGLVLEDGRIAWGDCTAVEFSGAAGRDPVFRAPQAEKTIQERVAPLLLNRSWTSFRETAEKIESLRVTVEEERLLPDQELGEKFSRRELFQSAGRLLSSDPHTETKIVERQLHSAVRYGVSQALLQAAALTQGITLPEVICREWDLPLPERVIPIHAQCGANRFQGADKMIVRRIGSLPHSLVDNIPQQLGDQAVHLIRYTKWLKTRIQSLGEDSYHPTIHLDVHGGLGKIYDNNLGEILGTLYALEQAAQPYPLRIECPVICASREQQIETLSTLREYIRFRKMKVQLVADEWANTLEDINAFLDGRAADMIQVKMPDLGGIQRSVEAVLACKEHGVGAFLGGSCAETDLSARITARAALAMQPDLVLAKPGMGIDEAITLISNEMARTLAAIRFHQRRNSA